MALTIAESSSSTSPYTSSSTPKLSTYHVFLSFRGEDTRKGFTDHLCAALERKGINTFRDDKDLERGQVISQNLLKAIQESMFAITILSQDYASSTWCLDELQKIMECNKSRGLEVFPVFYGVDPSDVRHQRGSYEEAFRKHLGQHSDKVEKWRDALTQVASHSGWDSKDKHEAELVKIIAQHIHEKVVPKLPSCTENLVGIASKMEEVKELIGMGLTDVRFIGIWGMGGIGKTTIARAVFEATRGEFEVTCFLANVRELSESETNGLVHLQRQLLSHLSIGKNDFHNLYDGKNTIINSLCRKKVLLVLDDVNEVKQLENLAGKQDWFGPGSRVIITTRDMHLLTTHGIHKTYEVAMLLQNEALNLFCLKAFKENQPKEGYLDLSKEVVNYCGGLPLALEVLGSYLYGRNIDVWLSAIKKLTSVPYREIIDTLMISYEGLDSMEKNIFLDIACFFKGKKKVEVINILENCGYSAQIVIEVLVERSLITLIKSTEFLLEVIVVEMHDLLQQMGRDIVIQKYPDDPSRRSRLWSLGDIDYVLTNNKGTEEIKSLCLEVSEYEAGWSTGAFSNMSKLKFLSLCGIQLPLGLSCLPSSLKVLHWQGSPLKTLPLRNQLNGIVDINLSYSEIEELWQGKQFMENLKFLNLTYSHNLKTFPDISGAPNLEKVILDGCTSLTKIHPSLVHIKKIVQLNLEHCTSLKSLPGKLEMSSLKILNISGCSKLCRLPDGLNELKYLEELHANGIPIDELPSYNFHINNLKKLSFSKCKGSLNTGFRFPSVWSLPSLRELNLKDCNLSEESIPDYFFQLPSLVSLDLSGNNFVRIPSNISELSILKILSLNRCQKLTLLPELPSSIIQLDASNCDSLVISKFNPAKLCSLFASPEQLSFFEELESIMEGDCLPSARFDMVIPGTEIPSWFVHHGTASSAKIQVPNNCPLDEWVGFALCFILENNSHYASNYGKIDCYLFAPNGEKLVTTRVLPTMDQFNSHLYILYMSIDQLRGKICEDDCWSDCIEFGWKYYRDDSFEIVRCGSRLVCKQDVEDWNKVVRPFNNDGDLEVASHSGWDSKDQHEAALVEENIDQRIHEKLVPKFPSCRENLVGIASRVEEVIELIGLGLNDVRFIGIWGMGFNDVRLGKTAIARAVFEAIRGEFEVACFLANVRKVSEQYGLVHLQRQLLSHLSISKNDFHTMYDGKKTIINSLCGKKVLLVLDGVNKVNQLENLAGKQDWFGPGSRVIITTRDKHVLTTHGIHKTYKVEKLFPNDALDLFCLKAFKENQPQEEYLDLSKEIVDYCGGLPLALEVLGSYLYGKNIDVWHSALNKLRSVPHPEIQDTLKISYEGLNSMEKNIFLDIACFFKRMEIEEVIDILEDCGYSSPQDVIHVLVERSLITLENWEFRPSILFVGMHELLRQMGRDIVFQEFPNDPSRRSRLWLQEDIDYVLKNNKGTEEIKSLCLKVGEYEAGWSTEAFSNMSQLKFLSLSGMRLPLGLSCLPSSLKVLHWIECPLKTLPLRNQLNEVIDIDLSLSNIKQLWRGKQFMENLEFLNLTDSKNLKTFPDISGAPNLEEVILQGCTSLTKIHLSLVHHKNVDLLNLEGCESLESLPGKLEMNSLKILNISGCSKLCRILDGLEELKCLEELHANNIAFDELPSYIFHLNNMKVLSFSGCEGSLTTGFKFPPSVWSLPSLRDLNLSYCYLSEESMPEYFWKLPSLVSLDLSYSNFVTIPSNISELPMLKFLTLNDCKKLKLLPELPSSIIHLDASNCESLEISKFNPAKPCSLFAFESIMEGDCLPSARFDMVIPGDEIPSWFVHHGTASSAKIQVPNHYPVDEWVGVALCFLIENRNIYELEIDCCLVTPNGEKMVSTSRLPYIWMPHLYIMYLSIDQLRDKICKDDCWSDIEFALRSRRNCSRHLKIMKCGSRLVCKQDVEDWNKDVRPFIQKE